MDVRIGQDGVSIKRKNSGFSEGCANNALCQSTLSNSLYHRNKVVEMNSCKGWMVFQPKVLFMLKLKLKLAKDADIERLKTVRRVRQKENNFNLVVKSEGRELESLMRSMAV